MQTIKEIRCYSPFGEGVKNLRFISGEVKPSPLGEAFMVELKRARQSRALCIIGD